MSLIKCPECDRSVSEYAEMCPNCGFPIDKTEKIEVMKLKDKQNSYFIDSMAIIICKLKEIINNINRHNYLNESHIKTYE